MDHGAACRLFYVSVGLQAAGTLRYKKGGIDSDGLLSETAQQKEKTASPLKIKVTLLSEFIHTKTQHPYYIWPNTANNSHINE